MMKRNLILIVTFILVFLVQWTFTFVPFVFAATLPGATECGACHQKYPSDFENYLDNLGDTTVNLGNCRPCHAGIYSEHGIAPIKPSIETSYGWFTSTESLNFDNATTVASIHTVHRRTEWADWGSCANCHTGASCNTCHSSEVGHDPHAILSGGTNLYPGITEFYGRGRELIWWDFLGLYSATLTCTNEKCHSSMNISFAARPSCLNCHSVNKKGHTEDSLTSSHAADLASLETTYIWNCKDCHLGLVDEHAKVDLFTCQTCHLYTGTKLDQTSVTQAILTENTHCDSCHPFGSHPDFSQSGFCYDCHPTIENYFNASLNLSAQHQVACSKCHGYHKNTKTTPFSNPDNLLEIYGATTIHPATRNTIPDYIDFCNRCHDNLPPEGVSIGTLRNIGVSWSLTDVHGSVRGGLTKAGLLKSVAHLSLPYRRGLSSLPCNDCHASHGSKNIYHFVETQTVTGLSGITVLQSSDCWRTDGKGICQACHTWMHPTTATATKMTSKHKTTSNDCLSCHFHGATKVISCGACHDLF